MINNYSIVLIVAGILLLQLAIVPASAELTTINRGGVIFIGEQGLDLSGSVGSYSKIAWWVTDSIRTGGMVPQKSVEISSGKSLYFVDPAIYSGYQGDWYQYDASAIPTYNALAFRLVDPTLSINIWDVDENKDVSEKLAPRGDRLSFHVNTNMYQALNPSFRPNVNPATDGFITIGIKDESGARLNSLYDTDSTPHSLLNQYVNTQPWYWGGASPVYWGTGQMINNQYRYPLGTYVVWAESGLNNMKNNYKNGEWDYTGKTISQTITVSLVTPASPATTTPAATTTTISDAALTTATTYTTTSPTVTATTTAKTTATTAVPTITTTRPATTVATLGPTQQQTVPATTIRTVQTTKTVKKTPTQITPAETPVPTTESEIPLEIIVLSLVIGTPGIFLRKK
jgi:hypothetical protein